MLVSQSNPTYVELLQISIGLGTILWWLNESSFRPRLWLAFIRVWQKITAGKLEGKPFTCTFCMSFWLSLITCLLLAGLYQQSCLIHILENVLFTWGITYIVALVINRLNTVYLS